MSKLMFSINVDYTEGPLAERHEYRQLPTGFWVRRIEARPAGKHFFIHDEPVRKPRWAKWSVNHLATGMGFCYARTIADARYVVRLVDELGLDLYCGEIGQPKLLLKVLEPHLSELREMRLTCGKASGAVLEIDHLPSLKAAA